MVHAPLGSHLGPFGGMLGLDLLTCHWICSLESSADIVTEPLFDDT
jgi:hypothetical protein